MPVWLLRILPHIGIALAIIGAVWWLDHRGYERAMGDRDARDAKVLAQVRADLRQSEARLAVSISGIAADYEATRASLSAARTTILPIVTKEVAHDPRLADPAAGLTPGLLDAVNRARQAGTGAAAASRDAGEPVPAASARH